MDKDAICNDCGQHWTATEVEDATPDEIPHFWERMEPGDVMPLGICPACESLCLPLWTLGEQTCKIPGRVPNSCPCREQGTNGEDNRRLRIAVN